MSIYKERFKKIARELIKRDGLENILKVMDNMDFYTAPASTKYHDSEPEGLVKHSLAVFDILETDLFGNNDFSMESIAIVSLFHDICKMGYYTTEMRNKKDENGKWIQVPYYTVDDKLPLGHGEKSVMMLMTDMKLTTEEIMAIRWHMGAYEGQQCWNTLGKAFEEFPLALHLHIADMKATYIK